MKKTSTLLFQANEHMRSKKYVKALGLYEMALNENPGLEKIINHNINLITKIIDKASATKEKLQKNSANLSTIKLSKPHNLDLYTYEQIVSSRLFDLSWYIEQYSNDYDIKENPLEHYLEFGISQNLNPSPSFNTFHYIKSNPDLANCDLHPFIHYVVQGRREDRSPLPFSSYSEAQAEYIPRLPVSTAPITKAARVIAFYLPQFHPIPENDAWWGKGFTEWTNVKPARPQFEGHYQPHIPDNYLGYYNLLDRKVQAKQIELAKLYGIEGFCFYLYWFSGKRLLEQPLDNYLNDPTLDFPFCVCWANENWSRRWDGLDHDLLMTQNYSDSDDIDFIKNCAIYLRDPRYIRIEGKPLLLIYRPNLFPDMKATANRWRTWCRTNGIGEIYLVYAQSFESVNPSIYGFDAATEFSPNNSSPKNITGQIQPIAKDFEGAVWDWRTLVERSENYQKPDYKLFRSVNPGWDNTARKKSKGSIFVHSSPASYQQWLLNAIRDTQERFSHPDERIIFVNAWNEWAEGAHLEPDQRYGYAYLESTRLAQVRSNIICSHTTQKKSGRMAVVIHAFYPDVFEQILEAMPASLTKNAELFISTIAEHQHKVRHIVSKLEMPSEVFVYDNHGRDVLPFLKMLRIINERDFDYLLKLHTKKSLHRDDGDRWRDDLYAKLLDSQVAEQLASYFEAHPEVGLIGPEGHIVNLCCYWGSNKITVESIARRLGITNLDVYESKFVAGTMFFARIAALEPLLNISLSEEEFEPEEGQVDGTLAHAIERAIALSAAATNMGIVSTAEVLGKIIPAHQGVSLRDFYKPDTNFAKKTT